jgi:hypothetical protein
MQNRKIERGIRRLLERLEPFAKGQNFHCFSLCPSARLIFFLISQMESSNPLSGLSPDFFALFDCLNFLPLSRDEEKTEKGEKKKKDRTKGFEYKKISTKGETMEILSFGKRLETFK